MGHGLGGCTPVVLVRVRGFYGETPRKGRTDAQQFVWPLVAWGWGQNPELAPLPQHNHEFRSMVMPPIRHQLCGNLEEGGKSVVRRGAVMSCWLDAAAAVLCGASWRLSQRLSRKHWYI